VIFRVDLRTGEDGDCLAEPLGVALFELQREVVRRDGLRYLYLEGVSTQRAQESTQRQILNVAFR
jgi:hypothetical protein